MKLIFVGVVPGMSGPETAWSNAVAGVYARDLVPVIRMNPHWGQTEVREWSDDSSHLSYTGYAQSFAAVVSGLPLREDWPIWIEVLNEPNLCYEWTCDSDAGTWMGYETTAAEYAALLRDVTAALHALGDPRIKVINAGLAPGGAVDCECGGSGFNAGITSLEFITAMDSAVPGVFDDLDGFASHAYPSSGEGWGFFEAYDDCAPGLNYWKRELDTTSNNTSSESAMFCLMPCSTRQAAQLLSARLTATTTSSSAGKPLLSFSATFWPSTQMVSSPRLPGVTSELSPVSFSMRSANLAARGL